MSKEKKFKQLSMHDSLSVCKSLQFVHYLRILASPKIHVMLYKKIGSQEASIHTILTAPSKATLNVLADLMDKIIGPGPTSRRVAGISCAAVCRRKSQHWKSSWNHSPCKWNVIFALDRVTHNAFDQHQGLISSTGNSLFVGTTTNSAISQRSIYAVLGSQYW